MKKIAFFVVALMALMACQESKSPFNYRGLAFSLPIHDMVDSLLARGFVVDSATSDSGRQVQLFKTGEPYHVLIAYEGDQLQAIQENYRLSTNDSTRRLWQEIRDGLEKELGAWPNCPILKDDHKKADFETDGGFISVTLENTYKPTLMVLYKPKKEKK
ncbi:MAG: hypothetical protein E7107_11725 [Prevotella sp.]|nr:hypothetical protein [Prevotella sp.]